jgi:hypothetical protein
VGVGDDTWLDYASLVGDDTTIGLMSNSQRRGQQMSEGKKAIIVTGASLGIGAEE